MPLDPAPLASLQNMVDRGVYITPTFTVLRNYGASLGTAESNLTQFVKLGGKVALGNDYGGGPGDFQLGIPMFEIAETSRAGVTPVQIIVASTSNPAHVIRMADSLGTLAAGKIADVLVVNGDPLQDLSALRDVRCVVHGGTVIRGGCTPSVISQDFGATERNLCCRVFRRHQLRRRWLRSDQRPLQEPSDAILERDPAECWPRPGLGKRRIRRGRRFFSVQPKMRAIAWFTGRPTPDAYMNARRGPRRRAACGRRCAWPRSGPRASRGSRTTA
jgi:hypothetical protein